MKKRTMMGWDSLFLIPHRPSSSFFFFLSFFLFIFFFGEISCGELVVIGEEGEEKEEGCYVLTPKGVVRLGKGVLETEEYKFEWDLCNPLNHKGPCQKAIACQTSLTPNDDNNQNQFSCGTGKPEIQGKNEGLSLIFSGGSIGCLYSERNIRFKVVCSSRIGSEIDEIEPCSYILTLSSPEYCPLPFSFSPSPSSSLLVRGEWGEEGGGKGDCELKFSNSNVTIDLRKFPRFLKHKFVFGGYPANLIIGFCGLTERQAWGCGGANICLKSQDDSSPLPLYPLEEGEERKKKGKKLLSPIYWSAHTTYVDEKKNIFVNLYLICDPALPFPLTFSSVTEEGNENDKKWKITVVLYSSSSCPSHPSFRYFSPSPCTDENNMPVKPKWWLKEEEDLVVGIMDYCLISRNQPAKTKLLIRQQQQQQFQQRRKHRERNDLRLQHQQQQQQYQQQLQQQQQQQYLVKGQLYERMKLGQMRTNHSSYQSSLLAPSISHRRSYSTKLIFPLLGVFVIFILLYIYFLQR